ncbi:MAG: glycosyltransferase family 4 protein, partial [Thermodesulfobacteriota bacterium]
IPELKDALFYMGSWGKPDLLPSYSVSPIHPEKRFPLDHLRLPGMDPLKPKKRITLVADTPGWAYDNISQNIQRYLGDLFEIDILYVIHYKNYTDFFFDLFCTRNTDFIHIFWREYFFAMLQHISLEDLRARIDPKLAAELFSGKIITTSIYDHLYLSDDEVFLRQDLFSIVDAYNVGSQRLKTIYDGKMNVPPDLVIEDGVDTDVYRPGNLERFSDLDRDFVVGWAGNSQWHLTRTEDPKGLHTILKPAVQILKNRGFSIKEHFADVSVKRRPRSEMPDYYNSLDVLVCSSAIEGTPNPILEAMSCGVPVISTDVGIIPQLFGPRQRKFILENRSPEEMADKLQSLIQDRTLMSALSRENLETIREWRWEHQMPKWMLLFKIAASRNDSRAVYRKRRLFLSYLQKLPEKEKSSLNDFAKKVAFRIYPDSIFWKNAKARILKPFRKTWNTKG